MLLPRAGDKLIELSVDADLPLEERVELLAYAFAKIVQGTILRQVVEWDVANGRIQFLVGSIVPTRKLPEGTVHAKLSDWPPMDTGKLRIIEHTATAGGGEA